jgi:hypothetical protein
MCRHSPSSPAARAAWGGLLPSLILGVTACGGSASPAGGTASPPPVAVPNSPPVAAPEKGSVAIRLTTSAGVPVPNVSLSLNGGFDGRTGRSDDWGWIRFPDIPAGEASAHTYARGFHLAATRFLVTPGPETNATIILEEVTEATPVVVNSRAVAASDGRSLTVDVDLAILGVNGRAIETLTAADFEMINSDCAFVPCGRDADYLRLPMGGYFVRADDTAFRWNVSSDRPVPPMAVGLLLDHSADMAGYDPARLRLPPVQAFLQSVLPPNTVSVAMYRDTNGLGVHFESLGPFTSDGAHPAEAIGWWAGLEDGGNPLYEAVSYMRWWTATNAPSGVDDPPPSVVIVTGPSWDSDYGALGTEPFAAYAATLSIPVVAIGGGELGAMVAAGSGGASVAVIDPHQFAVALGSLRAIVGRTLDSNHLRFALTPVGASQTGPVFRPGRQSLWAYLYVRIGPHTRVEVPLVMPVQ